MAAPGCVKTPSTRLGAQGSGLPHHWEPPGKLPNLSGFISAMGKTDLDESV